MSNGESYYILLWSKCWWADRWLSKKRSGSLCNSGTNIKSTLKQHIYLYQWKEISVKNHKKLKENLNLYLSKEVGDDHVRHGMSPATDLKKDMKTTFSFNAAFYLLVCFCVSGSKWKCTIGVYVWCGFNVCVTLCAAQSIHPSAHGLMLMSNSPSTMSG